MTCTLSLLCLHIELQFFGRRPADVTKHHSNNIAFTLMQEQKIKRTFPAYSDACPISVPGFPPQLPRGLASAELIRVNLLETQGDELII